MSRRKCPRTGKTSYPDQQAAKQAVGAIQQRATDGDHVPNRAYRCPFCAKWHLTSTESVAVPYTGGRREAPEPEELTDVEIVERDRDTLERVVRRCIADGCGSCMHDPDWGLYRIRRGMAS